MKKVHQLGSVTFLFIFIFSSIWIGSAKGHFEDWQVKLTADDLVPGADFGRSVAIDGNLVAVGAGGADAESVHGAGAVYLFKRRGRQYVPEAKLVAPDATTGAEFGRAVAIQGNRVVVGARFAQVGDLINAGAVYVFRKARGSWHLEAKITSPAPANGDNFGRALAIHGDLLVVTARKEEANAPDVGAAYVFRRRHGDWVEEIKLTAGDPAPGAYFGQSVVVRDDLIAAGARNADPIDTVQCAYFLEPTRKTGIDFELLTREKESIKGQKSKEPKCILLGEEKFLLHPFGSSSGYPIVMTNEDFKIEMGEFNRPNFFVTFRSL